ncbi:MAG TPA: DMT family transporter [Puia sp.]|nr:DMT family transporter [Puia sp.]
MKSKPSMNNSIFILMTLIVGFCFPVMAASNGMLGKQLGGPFVATLAVFQLGSILLLLIIFLTRSAVPSLHQLLHINWKIWLGCCIVILNLITFTVVPGKIGIANMIVLFIAGQLLASMVLEHFGLLNLAVHAINWQRLLGLVFLIAGVILIKKF